MLTAAAAFSGLASAPALAQDNTPPQQQAYCSSDGSAYRSSIYLAYIKSAPGPDAIAEAGLKSLAARLTEKTSLEESARDGKIRVAGLDIEQDDLCFFPVIYWPVNAESQPLSTAAQWKLQTYMARGGVLIFDIRDVGMEWESVRRDILGNINLGALEPMPRGHTLRNTFYANSDIPGSLNLESVYVQVPSGSSNEKVSRVIVGVGRNWAAAWSGMTLSTRSPAYEQALRGGVNLILYAFTGNYKGDQLLYQENLRKLDR